MTISLNKSLILEDISAIMRSRAIQGDPMSPDEIHNFASGNKSEAAAAATSASLKKGIEKASGIDGVEDPLEKAQRIAKFGK